MLSNSNQIATMPMRSNRGNTGPPAEKRLWENFIAGNFKAFEQLYTLHIEALILYGKKLNDNVDVVKDAIHDLFVELWHSRATLSKNVAIGPYLIKSLRYKLYRHNNTKLFQLSHFTEVDYGHHEVSAETVLSEKQIQDINKEKVRTAILTLSPRQQEAIFLSFYKGLSLQSIAHIMDMNYQSAANLIQRGIASIRKQFKAFPTEALLFLILLTIQLFS